MHLIPSLPDLPYAALVMLIALASCYFCAFTTILWYNPICNSFCNLLTDLQQWKLSGRGVRPGVFPTVVLRKFSLLQSNAYALDCGPMRANTYLPFWVLSSRNHFKINTIFIQVLPLSFARVLSTSTTDGAIEWNIAQPNSYTLVAYTQKLLLIMKLLMS